MRNNHGFTLLEILIALFIFTIVSIIMSSGLRTVMNSQAATEKKADQLATLQLGLLLFSRDVEQATNRPITNAKGNIEPSLIGSPTSVTFTHGGFANPSGQLARSTLQRTQYVFAKNQLRRDIWQVLDQTAKSLPQSRVLLNEISDPHFEYLTFQGKFSNHWPADSLSSSALPKGIRIQFTIKHWGHVTQFYLIPVSGEESAPKT